MIPSTEQSLRDPLIVAYWEQLDRTVIDPDRIRSAEHSKLAGLQVADAVAASGHRKRGRRSGGNQGVGKRPRPGPARLHWLEPQNYLIVLKVARDHFVLKTTYCPEPRRRMQLQRDYASWKKTGRAF